MNYSVDWDGPGERDDDDEPFDAWMQSLNEDVIQGEYGYEEGEFTAYPTLWRPLYDEGLTPQDAFARALAAHRPALPASGKE
jgi:hypothetical protein